MKPGKYLKNVEFKKKYRFQLLKFSRLIEFDLISDNLNQNDCFRK